MKLKPKAADTYHYLFIGMLGILLMLGIAFAAKAQTIGDTYSFSSYHTYAMTNDSVLVGLDLTIASRLDNAYTKLTIQIFEKNVVQPYLSSLSWEEFKLDKDAHLTNLSTMLKSNYVIIFNSNIKKHRWALND